MQERGMESDPRYAQLMSFMTNSALTTLILQPPPIRKEMDPLPTILKAGERRVPWGPSPIVAPAGESGEGRFSEPPIHQFPC